MHAIHQRHEGLPNCGRKKPQLLHQQPQVVTGAAQYRMQRITERPFQRITTESPIHFHVPDRGLDRTAPLDRRLQGARETLDEKVLEELCAALHATDLREPDRF